MSTDTRFAGLLGAWPPSGPPPLLDPAQGQMQGLLPAPASAPPIMGLLDIPDDPSSLSAPASFGPMALVAGAQGLASPPLDPGSWLQALQALHQSLAGPPNGGPTGSEMAGAAQPPPAPVARDAVMATPAVKAGDLLSSDPSRAVTNVKPSGLVQVQAPSPHAGDYASGDEAAKAGQADIPQDTPNEYGTWIERRQVPETFPDIGAGPLPFLLDRFKYPGLFTSNDPDKVFFGPVPADAAGWLHNHPRSTFDLGNDDQANANPSPADGARGDWYFARQVQKTKPDFGTYIVGPDGVLRRFQHNDSDGVVVK
jgi:hypothetical protein